MELKESHIVAGSMHVQCILFFLCKLYLFSACGHMNEESFPIGAYGKWQLGINLIWTKECFCLPNSETKFGKTRNPPF